MNKTALFTAASIFVAMLMLVANVSTANPDFTQGDKIPEGANHDWTLGPTGARGWMFSDKLVTADARQMATTAELERIADYFENDEENFPRQLSLQKARLVRETIRAIEASDEYPELICIE